jgi:hypothetical protein
VTRKRLAWAIRTTRHDIIDPDDIYFAPTRSKARARLIADLIGDSDLSFAQAAREVRYVVRAPHRDVALPPRHPLAEQIGQALLDNVVHAYGGKSLKAGYRDYFYTTTDDPELVRLVELGLFRMGKPVPFSFAGGKPHAYFTLTALGRLVAAGEQPEYPHR